MSVATPKRGDPSEPDRSFSHARLKVQWADTNLSDLTDRLNKFIKIQQQAPALRSDAQGEIIFDNAAVPIEFALIAGDMLFNLRSALDCCWMGLRRSIDATADKGTLPRNETRDNLVSTLDKITEDLTVEGLGDFVADDIRPYKDGNEVLWFIAKIDNWNKHNMITLALSKRSLHSLSIKVTPRGGVSPSTISFSNCEFVGDTPLTVMSMHGRTLDLEHETKPQTSFDVILDSKRPVDKRPLLPFLVSAVKETHKAVEVFVSTFGKHRA